jgi:hypothetical protein
MSETVALLIDEWVRCGVGNKKESAWLRDVGDFVASMVGN